MLALSLGGLCSYERRRPLWQTGNGVLKLFESLACMHVWWGGTLACVSVRSAIRRVRASPFVLLTPDGGCNRVSVVGKHVPRARRLRSGARVLDVLVLCRSCKTLHTRVRPLWWGGAPYITTRRSRTSTRSAASHMGSEFEGNRASSSRVTTSAAAKQPAVHQRHHSSLATVEGTDHRIECLARFHRPRDAGDAGHSDTTCPTTAGSVPLCSVLPQNGSTDERSKRHTLELKTEQP